MHTSTLDTWAPGQRPPRARANDPISSHSSADRIEITGHAGRMMGAVLDAVRQHPGRTSRELAGVTGMDRHEIAKRLPDLRRRGLVDSPPTEQDLRWWAVPPDQAATFAKARENARNGFSAAGRNPSPEDLAAAAALERRVLDGRVERERGREVLRDVYAGRRRARLEADGLVRVARPGGA